MSDEFEDEFGPDNIGSVSLSVKAPTQEETNEYNRTASPSQLFQGIKTPEVPKIETYAEPKEGTLKGSTVNKQGQVTLREKPKKKSAPLQNIQYNYKTMNEDGSLTEYGTDQSVMQQITRRVQNGETMVDVIQQTGKQNKYKALMFNELVDKKGVSREFAAQQVGIPLDVLEGTDAMSRYVQGVKADNLETAAGAYKLVAGTNVALGSTSLVDEKQADAFKARADEFGRQAKMEMDKFDTMSDLYNNLNTTYSEKTGVSATPWDLAGTAGQMTTDLALGAAVGTAVKGVDAFQTAGRQASTMLGLDLAKSTAKYGQHGSIPQFAMDTASSLGGEALGLWMTRRLMPKELYTNSATKSADEVTTAIDGLVMMKKYDLDIGSEDLLQPGMIKQKVDTLISEGKMTEPEALEILKLYEGRSAGLMLSLKGSLQSLGITDARILKDYADGKIPFAQMPDMFKDTFSAKLIQQQGVNAVNYRALELDPGYKDIVKADAFINSLEEISRQDKAVSNFIKSEWKHLKGYQSLEDKAISKSMAAANQSKRTAAKNTIDVNNAIAGVEAQYNKITGNIASLKTALNRESNPAKRISLGGQIVEQETQQRGKQQVLGNLRQKRGGYVSAYNRAETSRDQVLNAYMNMNTPTKMSFEEAVLLSKALQQKKYVAGGAINTHSSLQVDTIDKSLVALHKFMKNNWGDQNVYGKWKKASDDAVDGFNMWGGSRDTKAMRKILEEGTPEEITAAFSNQKSLNMLKEFAGPDSEVYQKMVARTIGDKALKGVSKPTGPTDIASADFGKLVENINNPEFRDLVANTVGPEAYRDIKAISHLGEVFGAEFEGARISANKYLNKKRVSNEFISLAESNKKLSSRVKWLMERYSGQMLKLKHHTGPTNIGPIKNSMRNAISDAIEITSEQLGFRLSAFTNIKQRPNMSTSIDELLGTLRKDLEGMGNEEKASFASKLADNIKAMWESGNNMRGGYLKWSEGSSEIASELGDGFDPKNFPAGDLDNLSKLQPGDYATDSLGRTFKVGKSIFKEVFPPDKGGSSILGSLTSKKAKKLKPGTTVFVDGKHYKKLDRPEATYTRTDTVEGGKKHVVADMDTSDRTIPINQDIKDPNPVVDEQKIRDARVAYTEQSNYVDELFDRESEVSPDFIEANLKKLDRLRDDTLKSEGWLDEDIVKRNQMTEHVNEMSQEIIDLQGKRREMYDKLSSYQYQPDGSVSDADTKAIEGLANEAAAIDLKVRKLQENRVEVRNRMSQDNKHYEGVLKAERKIDKAYNPNRTVPIREHFDPVSGEVVMTDTTKRGIDSSISGAKRAIPSRATSKSIENIQAEIKFNLGVAGFSPEKTDKLLSIVSDRQVDLKAKREAKNLVLGGGTEKRNITNRLDDELEWDIVAFDSSRFLEEGLHHVRGTEEYVTGYMNTMSRDSDRSMDMIKEQLTYNLNKYKEADRIRVSHEDYVKTQETLETLNRDIEYADARIGSIIDGERSRLHKELEIQPAINREARGTAQFTSPLDDAISQIRRGELKGPTPSTGTEWTEYLSGISYDEMKGSGLGDYLTTRGKLPVALDSVESILNTRKDNMYKVDAKNTQSMGGGSYQGYAVDEYGDKLNRNVDVGYKDNVYLSQLSQDIPAKEGSATKHFNPHKASDDLGEYTTHSRESTYVTYGGGKGKVLQEGQSDMYQNLVGSDGKLEIGDNHIFEVNNWIDEAQDGDSSLNSSMYTHNMDMDAVQDTISEVEGILKDNSIYPGGDISDNITEAILHSPNPMTRVKEFLDEVPGIGIPQRNTIMDRVFTRVQEAQVKAINDSVPSTNIADIPYGQGWFKNLFGREIVDAYNEGFSEVKVPIGKFVDKGTRLGTTSNSSPVNSASSQIARHMARGDGPTKWYTQAVLPYLEELGISVDAKNISYDEGTEMLTITMPEAPFNVTRKGVGTVSRGSQVAKSKSNIVEHSGQAYRDEVPRTEDGKMIYDIDNKKYIKEKGEYVEMD